jgi:hypothetical protein
MSQQQQPNFEQDRRASLGWMLFLVRSLSFSIEVVLRRDFGERYCDGKGVAAIFILLFYAAFYPHGDRRWVLAYLGVYLAMCVRAAIGVQRGLRRSGDRSHTRYNGFPRLMGQFPKRGERWVKANGEPMFVLSVGVLVFIVNAPMGVYLIAAGIALFLIETSMEFSERRRALDLHDSVIDQRFLAERLRRMNRRR